VLGRNMRANNSTAIQLGAGGSIGGNLQVRGLTGAPLGSDNSLCDTTVTGNVQVHNNGSGSPIDVGDLGTCAGEPGLTVGGNLQVRHNAANVTIGGNKVNGNLQVQNNTAEVTVSGNAVKRNVQVNNNTVGGGTLTGNSDRTPFIGPPAVRAGGCCLSEA
jgi:hypothetical protein